MDLSKQQALGADRKAIQRVNFTGNLTGNNNRVMFFITEDAILDFSQRTVKVL